MEWTIWAGLAAGLLISTVTAPVGVSGAVFLLPVQLSVLGVPSPAVTPTNLLFNVVAGPGALWRYRRSGALHGTLARRLVIWTLPGVAAGAAVHVFVLPGPDVFRLLIAALLLPLGLWLCIRTQHPAGKLPPAAAEGPSRIYRRPSPGRAPSPHRSAPVGRRTCRCCPGLGAGCWCSEVLNRRPRAAGTAARRTGPYLPIGRYDPTNYHFMPVSCARVPHDDPLDQTSERGQIP